MNDPQARDHLGSASRWFGRQANDLDATARRVLANMARRHAVTEDPNQKLDAQSTYGDRLADQVAAFGGSWRFIILFGLILVAWV
ncbi:MAG: hypothetical protein ACREP7_13765, partial [Lysobacter sp.]